MPTGYTCRVQDGTITMFRDFAIQCARAFGANILMRDDPAAAPIREYEPDPYHRDAIEKAREDIYDAERLTMTQAESLLAAERVSVDKARSEAMERRKTEMARYEVMLVQVRAWTPPTPDHEGIKAFMVQQLEESIRFDCGDVSSYYKASAETPAEFIAARIAKAKRDIEYHAREWENEQRRTRERNEWNRALFASLPAPAAR